MSVSVQIGTTDSTSNVIDKNVSLGVSVTADLKQPCSVETPVFILKTNNDYLTANYLYCDDFQRYYYVTDVQVLSGERMQLTCTVDVLKSYSEQIKNLKVNVSRTETEFGNVIDSSLVTTANDEVVFLNFSGELEPARTGSRTFLLITSN